MSGPMKEKDLTPGTVFPVLGTLLFFLPERYREKLCCITPLAKKVTSDSIYTLFSWMFSPFVHCALSFPYCPCWPAQTNQHAALSEGPERPQRSSVLQRGHSHRGQRDREWESTNRGGRPGNKDRSALVPAVRPRCSGDSLVITFSLLLLTRTRHTHRHFDPQLLYCLVPRGEVQRETDHACDVHQWVRCSEAVQHQV